MLDKVVGYSLVDLDEGNEFSGLDQFARRFDKRFITEDEIKKLWEGTSAQHGGKYLKSDFHSVGPKGGRVVKQFVERFAGIDATAPTTWYGKGYKGDGDVLTLWENADGHQGRDIKVSHRVGVPYVWYSSEYSGCGNGRYGLLATEKTFLWTEDD
jgi:hypothetical protein